MNIRPLAIPGLLLVEPRLFGDERGFFFESYSKARFDAAVGEPVDFVQDNHSRSTSGVLRGLHYQLPPKAQGKLLRVTLGAIWDVAVDIRPGSPTFGRWEAVELSAENRLQLCVPPGFAHGFVTLSDAAELLYKTTDYYAPEQERAVAWNDPALAIPWPTDRAPTLSAKDAAAPPLARAAPFA